MSVTKESIETAKGMLSDSWEKRAFPEMKKAMAEAATHGQGFIRMSALGEMKHVPLEEVFKLVDHMREVKGK